MIALAAACGNSGGGGSGTIILGDAAVAVGEPAGITDLHNQARAMVSPAASPALAPLTWSTTVASAAQAWADTCTWGHSSNSYGENIYASAGAPANASGVVGSWVSEASSYNYSGNSCSNVCGHYTQVVWRDTTELGCAIKHCTTGSPFANFPNWDLVVCDYSPPGNYNGQRPY